jgi:hypothetical protein
MENNNNNFGSCAQSSGTDYCKNSTLFNRVKHFCHLKNKLVDICHKPFDFVHCDIDSIDYIEVRRVGEVVEMRVMYQEKHLFSWIPKSLCFDFDDGFCFEENDEIIWHVVKKCAGSLLGDLFTLRIVTTKGVCIFSSESFGFIEFPDICGTRWVNPATKSITMPCDGRGGGFQPQMMHDTDEKFISRRLIKKWNREMRKESNSRRRRYTLKRRIASLGRLDSSLFDPQMLDNIFSKVPGSQLATGIADVARAVHDCAVNGVKLPVDLTARLDTMLSEVSQLNESISNVVENGVQHHHTHEVNMGNFFSFIIENRTTIGVFALCFLICCLLVAGKKTLAVALAGLVAAFLMTTDFPSWLKERWDFLMSTFSMKEVTDFDEVFEPQGILESAPKALLLFGYLAIFRNLDTVGITSKFESIYQTLAFAPKATDKFVEVLSGYGTLCQSLVNDTMTWIGIEKQFNWFGDKYPAVTTLVKECEKFLTDCTDKSKDLIVARAAQTSQVLQNQILDLLVKNKADKDFVGSERLLKSFRARLAVLDKDLELRGAGRSVTRVAPKAFLFIGKAGIGKSYLLQTLCTMLLYKLFEHDETALKRIEAGQTRDFIFTRNSNDKFWEGYYNQTIVYLDEVAMEKDVAGGNGETNEYGNFVKMVNDVCFPLPMANVEKKGTCEFDSDVILGTTNSYHFNIDSINNKGAYDRRWIKYEIEVDPRFGYMHDEDPNSGVPGWLRPDFEKIRAGMSTRDIALSKFLRFRERASLFRPTYVGEWMDTEELIERMRKEVALRELEKKGKKEHGDILRDIFTQKLQKTEKNSMPGGFEPQSNECICKACSGEWHPHFTQTEQFFYKDCLGISDLSVFEKAFHAGFVNMTKDKVCMLTDDLCIQKTLKILKNAEPGQMGLLHGYHCRSLHEQKYVEQPQEDQKQYYIGLLKKLAAFVGVALSFVGVYKFINYLCSNNEEEKIFGFAFAPEEIVPQQKDLNAQEVLYSVLKRNVYAIGDDAAPFKGFATFIRDNIFVVPLHYITFWREGIRKGVVKEIHLRRLGDKVNHQVIKFDASILMRDDLLFQWDPSEDLCAFYLDNRVMQRHATLRPHLMDELKVHTKGELLFPVVDKHDLRYEAVTVPFEVARDRPIVYTIYDKKHGIKNPIVYRRKTEKGDCGLPVAVKDPLLRKEKIFGIHVSGAPSIGVGVSAPFTVEKFDAICRHFAQKYDLIEAQYRTDAMTVIDMTLDQKGWNDLFAAPEEDEVPGKVNLCYLDPPTLPTKTTIIPSPLYKKIGFEPKTKPAKLHPFEKDGEIRDPSAIAKTKYHKSTEKLDLAILDLCKNNVTNQFLNGPMISQSEIGARVLTFEEAVAGIPGVDGCDGMPRKTSSGYPYCKYVDKKGKRDFFGEDGDYILDSPGALKIKGQCEDIVASAKNNVRLNHVFVDFLKDERRPKHKVDAGSTRGISGCPLTLAITIRQYFGSFVQHAMANRVYNQSAMGVNVFDRQWELIAKYLGEDARIIAGDFSNYDGRLPYAVMKRFLDTVTDFYGDAKSDNARIREILFEELVNSRHITEKGVVYEWVGSNASGNPLTTILNSWCNLVLLRYATLKCVNKMTVREAKPFLAKMDSFLRFMVYGDDNLISINRESEYASLLTQDAYTAAFAEMGLDYTDESKSGGQIDQDRSIGDVSFLKRKWKTTSISQDRKYMSALDVNTILESIQWTKKKDGAFDAVKENVVNMLQELSQHEESIFDEWAPKIVRAAKEEMSFVPLPNTYAECQIAVQARDMVF